MCDAEDALWLLHPQGGCPHTHYANGYGSTSSQGTSCVCSHDHGHDDCDHDDDGGDGECECECDHSDDGDAASGSCCCSACDGAASHDASSSCADSHHHHHHHHHPSAPAHHHHPHHHSPPEKAPHNPLRPPGSPTLAPEAEEPDPLVALETLRRTELLELLSLTGSHASFIREGRKSVERVRIVECLFRRLISKDEELLVKAYRGGHDHVRALALRIRSHWDLN